MERKILDLFLFDNKLKFNEIEKKLGIRSNKLVYHLKNLVGKGILVKEGEYYCLSESSEHLIPYLSDKQAPLPVVLICIGDSRKCLLYKRDKRPYKDKYGLPGGRLLVGEDLKLAVKRIMKEKYHLDARLNKIHSVSLEHGKNKGKVVHSFVLFFVSAKTKDKVELIDLEKKKKDMIKSDYFLVKNDLKKEVRINKF